MELIQSTRTLEITILSAEDLRVDRKAAAPKNLYVVLRAETIKSYTTCMAKEGATNINPTWNHKLVVDVPLHARSITFEVKSKSLKGVKDVGVARVAVMELIGGVGGFSQPLQFLSYRLRDWEGRRNGVLNFSVRVVNSPEYMAAKVAPAAVEKVMSPCGLQMRGTMDASSSSSCSSVGVVTGVPVWWNNNARNNV